MKLFKKLLAVTLVAVLALTVFTACGDSSGVPESTAEMKYWQDLNTAARAYGTDNGTILNDVPYSKDLSDYTWQKLNAYINLKNEKDDSTLEYTEDEVTKLFDAINDKCKSEKNYKATVYVVSEPNKAPDYKVLYQRDGFGYESTSRFLNADYIGVASIKNEKGDSKTYVMMECYQKID